MDGFIFLDKSEGITSTKEGSKLKSIFNTKKIGHVGTLDPFATGLLIIGVNKGTKAITFFDDFSKEYVATIKLGIATDSMDLTGKEIVRKVVPNLSLDKINEVLRSFLGKSQQLPPMTSAIKINGQKLYKLAHQGKEIDRPLRDIEVFDIELLNHKNDEITFRALVSKGTYIRVLASDIAIKLGTVGHLTKLRRTKVGPFDVKQSIKIDEVKLDSLISTYDVLKEFAEEASFENSKIEDIKNGKVAQITYNTDKTKLLITDKSHNAIAMYVKVSNNIFRFARGLF